MTIYGAEKVLEREEATRNIKRKFASAGAKYVPSSIQEIQLGTTLEIAQQSRVSFDPDNKLGDEATLEEEIENREEIEEKIDEVKNETAKTVGVADVASALVVFSTHISSLCVFLKQLN